MDDFTLEVSRYCVMVGHSVIGTCVPAADGWVFVGHSSPFPFVKGETAFQAVSNFFSMLSKKKGSKEVQ